MCFQAHLMNIWHGRRASSMLSARQMPPTSLKNVILVSRNSSFLDTRSAPRVFGRTQAAVAEFPRPKDKKVVQRLLGLCICYCRFVEAFSKIAEWKTKNSPSQNYTNNFKQIRCSYILTTLLKQIHTDASNVGLGAILVQR